MTIVYKRVVQNSNQNAHNGVLLVNENKENVETQGKQKEDGTDINTSAIASMILSPALITTFVLIFGGCCSNVYTLESILALSPATGSLITFLQFFFTSLFTLSSQLTTSRPLASTTSKPSSYGLPRLRSRKVPINKWLIYTVLFLTINILNNNAFNYRISVPLHIILRSAGPVTSMLVGYMFAGRTYEIRKVIAVLLLFCGVVLAALSDASSKGKVAANDAHVGSELSKQIPGFILLFSALLVSAFMGIYSDNLFRKYGRSAAIANESLFYSHVLPLPYFAVQYRSLYSQYHVMLSTASVQAATRSTFLSQASLIPDALKPLAGYFSIDRLFETKVSTVPVLLLLANAFTQIACITGVNRLSTQTTSLTVSIVLNVRKLVSLLLSIWMFGNRLPPGVVIGAAIVFFGGGLYGFPSSARKMTNKNLKAESLTKKNS